MSATVPRSIVVLRSRRLGWSARLDARAVSVGLFLAALTAIVFAWSLAVGDFDVPIGDVVASLVGRGERGTDFIVRTLRLPRGLTALLTGAAFGLSGAIFQRLARNPLASPDIIGIEAGAAAAAVFVVVIVGGAGTTVTAGALVGGLVTAMAVYFLSYRRGITGYRLVLVGIGISAMLTAITSYLLTRAELADAQRALVWLTGSLNGRGWEHVRPVSLGLLILVPATLATARSLRMLELGDDAAIALGARVERGRACLVVCGCLLAAVATASVGPVGFVSLVAPQIGRHLVGHRSVGLVAAGLCGSLLMLSSDLVGRTVFSPTELPVGIITAVLGAPYLLFLLARANRVGSGG